MKNKNILYVLPIPKFFSKTNGVGGHIAHVYGIINGFKKADHNVNIISEESHHSLEQDLKKLQVIPKNNGFVWRFKILNSIRRACNESTDFCYMRYSASFSPWLLFVKFFLNSTPLILELNSVATQSHYWMRWLERFAINKADIIICVSDSFYHYIFQTFGKTISNKTLLVTNGVDAERFNKSVYKSDNVNKNYLGYVGILKKDYDLDTLIDAFSLVLIKYPNTFLCIYGDGPYKGHLEQKASIISKNIKFFGAIPFVEVPQIMQNMDILIYTMSVKNNFGSSTKLCEYMAANKPIVASSTPHVKLLFGNEEKGLLYEPSNHKMMAAKIIELLDDPKKSEKLANNARVEVATSHTWDSKVKLILSHFDANNN